LRARCAADSIASGVNSSRDSTTSAARASASGSAIVTRHALAWTVWIIGLDWRVPFVRPALLAGDVKAAVDVPDLQHLIA
jgi:hypothetical protein